MGRGWRRGGGGGGGRERGGEKESARGRRANGEEVKLLTLYMWMITIEVIYLNYFLMELQNLILAHSPVQY